MLKREDGRRDVVGRGEREDREKEGGRLGFSSICIQENTNPFQLPLHPLFGGDGLVGREKRDI